MSAPPRHRFPAIILLIFVMARAGRGAEEEPPPSPPPGSAAPPPTAGPPEESAPPREERLADAAVEGPAPDGGERLDGPPAPADEAPQAEDQYRPLGPSLFPFYTHELRTADDTEVRQVLGLYQSTRSRRDGSRSSLLLPLYYSSHQVEPRDDRLYLMPLYWSRASDPVSFRMLLPFFYHYRTPESSFTAVPPLWLRFGSRDEQVVSHHVLFPLFRALSDRTAEGGWESRFRLGIPFLLELLEGRSTPGEQAYAGLNLLNWKRETEGGIAIYRSRWRQEGDRRVGSTHFFPFYWRGRGSSSDYLALMPLFGYLRDGERWNFALFPFYWQGRGASSSYVWVVPAFGHFGDVDRDDYVLIPALSRYGSGPGDALRVDALFPLFHYARGKDEHGADHFSLASYLLFDYSRSAEKTSFGALLWLYRATYLRPSGDQIHTILFPLGYFYESGDGAEGRRWLFPYYDAWDRERRTTLALPFYFKRQAFAQGEPDAYLTVFLPTYFSVGTPSDNFSAAVPLYWAKRDGPRGWRVLFPFYWDFYSSITRNTFAIPLAGYRSSPAFVGFYLGGILYIYEGHYDLEGQSLGSSHSLLWPLVTVENLQAGYNYRFLPLFWIRKEPQSTGMLITPFYYRQTSPRGTFSYIFPIYARRDGESEVEQFYAAGTYMRSRAFADDGRVIRSRDDFLWWLISFQRNQATRSTHQRVLPLGYWRTETPAERHTIAFPFYYSHRVSEEYRTHHLDLFLGNVFLSKIIEGPAETLSAGATAASPAAASEPPPAATTEPAPGGGDSLESQPAPLVEQWRDQGVLWPLSRWYKDRDQASGHWLIPLYFNTRSSGRSNLALFPLYFQQHSAGRYEASFFRYFFLLDRETFSDGFRFTAGQVLFDWLEDRQENRTRWRLLYPLFELDIAERGFSYKVTHLISGVSRLEGGERYHRHQIVPIFWEGATERLDAAGNWVPERSHFLLFPLYGVENRATRRDVHVLYPFIHFQSSPDTFNAEVWPAFFYRRNPALRAVRLWPLHAHEQGETAEDFWVPWFLFASKYFERSDGFRYRLDPFILRVSSSPDESGIGGLFELMAYDRRGEETTYRALPFFFGFTRADSAVSAWLPLLYREEYRSGPIDYWSPWRYFFAASRLLGADGERHFSILTKLYDHTDNPRRPQYTEHRVLHRFFWYRNTETETRLEINPFYGYRRDSARDETSFYLPFLLYHQETAGGTTRRTLFYFIEF